MPTVINSATLGSVTRTVRGLHLDALRGVTSLLPLLTMGSTTTTGESMFAWLGSIPSMKPFVKELELQTLAASDWTVKTAEYAMGYEIEAKVIRRDQFGIYAPVFSEAGRMAGEHRDELLAEKLITGFAQKDYTGKNFFDTGKEFVKGSKVTFDNKGTGQLTMARFREARKALRKIKMPNGKPLHGRPSFTLIVGPDLEGAATDILFQTLLNGGGTNTEYNKAKLEVWPYIEDGKWFLTVDNSVLKPFVNVNEIDLDLYTQQDMASESVFKRHTFGFQSYGIYNIDYGLPQLIYGSTGVAA